jgi:molybdopterin-guanine dinucleotide biosynthesis protein A
MEPLHAIYTKECLPPINNAIRRGEKRIRSIFNEVRVRYVEETAIRRFDPNMEAFININRPKEFRIAAARKAAEADTGPIS